MKIPRVFTISIFILAFTGTALTYSTYERNQEGQKSLSSNHEGTAESGQSPSKGQLRTVLVEFVEPPSPAELKKRSTDQETPQEATQATTTARAILARKKFANSILRRDVEEIHETLEGEVRQYQLAEQSTNTAKEAAIAAEEQVKSLNEVLQRSKLAAEQTKAAIEKAEAEWASQTSMVNIARGNHHESSSQLQTAWKDLEATRQAAEKASAAAKEAIENVSRARSYSSQKFEERPRGRSETESLAADIYYDPY